MKSIKRHVAKAITWRIIGTLDTILLGFLLTGDMKIGLKIGAAEMATKMVLYFIHERIWFNIHVFKANSSRTRHVLKTITWRFFGVHRHHKLLARLLVGRLKLVYQLVD